MPWPSAIRWTRDRRPKWSPRGRTSWPCASAKRPWSTRCRSSKTRRWRALYKSAEVGPGDPHRSVPRRGGDPGVYLSSDERAPSRVGEPATPARIPASNQTWSEMSPEKRENQRRKTMRTTKTILPGLIASLAISGLTLMAGTTAPPRSMEDRVRHEILSVPYINVFDNLSYAVDNGVVTLSGQVTRPDRQRLCGTSRQKGGGGNPHRQPDRSAAVIALRRSDSGSRLCER